MSHWYDADGNPRHYEGKNGKGTTLREARKLDLYPSVTTIGSVVHKDGLVKWLQEEAAIATADYLDHEGLEAWFNARSSCTERQFVRARIAEAKAKTDAKADAGTDIHDVLEQFLKDPFSCSKEDQKMCFAIADCIREHTGLNLFDDFVPEARFCNSTYGYGGTCDLHTPEGTVVEKWVIDYKTKDEVTDKTRGWPNQAEQLAAYSHGLGIPNARIANIFIQRDCDPNEPVPIMFFEHEDDLAWERFKHQCYLWQITKKYGPYYDNYLALKKEDE